MTQKQNLVVAVSMATLWFALMGLVCSYFQVVANYLEGVGDFWGEVVLYGFMTWALLLLVSYVFYVFPLPLPRAGEEEKEVRND